MIHFDAFWSLTSVFASSQILARDFIVVEVGRDFSSARGHCCVIYIWTGSTWSSRRLARKLIVLRQLGRLIRLWNSRAVFSGHLSLNFYIWNFAFNSLAILFLEAVLFLYLRSLLHLLSLGSWNILCRLLLLHLLQLLYSNVFFSLMLRVFGRLSGVSNLLGFIIFGLDF